MKTNYFDRPTKNKTQRKWIITLLSLVVGFLLSSIVLVGLSTPQQINQNPTKSITDNATKALNPTTHTSNRKPNTSILDTMTNDKWSKSTQEEKQDWLYEERLRILSKKKVYAYMPSWGIYGGHELFDVKNIDYSGITHMTYSFLKPIDKMAPKFDPKDPDADQDIDNITSSTTNAGVRWDDYDANFSVTWDNQRGKIARRMRQQLDGKNKFLVFSVGGWTYSENQEFENATSTPQKIENFVNNIIDFLDNNGYGGESSVSFDGVDIDWEFPTTPQAQQQFLDFHKRLREKLDEKSLAMDTPKYYQLSTATTPNPDNIQYISPSQIAQFVDTINYMAYDYHGGSFGNTLPNGKPNLTNHNAPLYEPSNGTPQDNFWIDAVVQEYIKQGVPANQLLIGVPFYGRSWVGVEQGTDPTHPGLNMPGVGLPMEDTEVSEVTDDGTIIKNPDSTGGLWGNGSNPYYRYEDLLAGKVIGKSNDYQLYYDNGSPYLYSPTDKIFHSFDDAKSIQDKVNYIIDGGFAGTIIWDITGDTRSGTDFGTTSAYTLGNKIKPLVGMDNVDITIELSPNNDTTIQVDQELELSATIMVDNKYPSFGVEYSSSNSTIATISKEGIIKGIKPGETTITATSSINTTKKETIKITVVEDNIPPEIIGITLSPEKETIKLGERLTIKATVEKQGDVDDEIYWTSPTQNITGFYNIDDNKNIVIHGKGIGVGTIYAKVGKLEAAATITVVDDVLSISVTAQPNKTTYQQRETFDPTGLEITAKVKIPNSSTDKILDSSQYQLSDTSTNTVGTKTITVTELLTLDPADQKTTTFDIEVIPRTDPEIPVTSILISGSTTLEVGTTSQYTATVLPSDATDKTISWQSSDTTLATMDTNGLLTTLAAGSITITATSISDPSIKGTLTVTITQGNSQPTIKNITVTAKMDYIEVTSTAFDDKIITEIKEQLIVTAKMTDDSSQVLAVNQYDITITQVTTSRDIVMDAENIVTVTEKLTSISQPQTGTLRIKFVPKAPINPDKGNDGLASWVIPTIVVSGAFLVIAIVITIILISGKKKNKRKAPTMNYAMQGKDRNYSARSGNPNGTNSGIQDRNNGRVPNTANRANVYGSQYSSTPTNPYSANSASQNNRYARPASGSTSNYGYGNYPEPNKYATPSQSQGAYQSPYNNNGSSGYSNGSNKYNAPNNRRY